MGIISTAAFLRVFTKEDGYPLILAEIVLASGEVAGRAFSKEDGRLLVRKLLGEGLVMKEEAHHLLAELNTTPLPERAPRELVELLIHMATGEEEFFSEMEEFLQEISAPETDKTFH